MARFRYVPLRDQYLHMLSSWQRWSSSFDCTESWSAHNGIVGAQSCKGSTLDVKTPLFSGMTLAQSLTWTRTCRHALQASAVPKFCRHRRRSPGRHTSSSTVIRNSSEGLLISMHPIPPLQRYLHRMPDPLIRKPFYLCPQQT